MAGARRPFPGREAFRTVATTFPPTGERREQKFTTAVTAPPRVRQAAMDTLGMLGLSLTLVRTGR
jgi:hypothetical protein